MWLARDEIGQCGMPASNGKTFKALTHWCPSFDSLDGISNTKVKCVGYKPNVTGHDVQEVERVREQLVEAPRDRTRGNGLELHVGDVHDILGVPNIRGYRLNMCLRHLWRDDLCERIQPGDQGGPLI